MDRKSIDQYITEKYQQSLSEISKDLARKYIKKAAPSLSGTPTDKSKKRAEGYFRASGKLSGVAKVPAVVKKNQD